MNRLSAGFAWVLFLGLGWAGTVFLALPLVVGLATSFGESPYLQFPPQGFTLKWYAAYLTDATWIEPTVFSLRIATIVAVLASILGTAAAVATERSQSRLGLVLQMVFLAPLITPTIVLALAMFFVFAKLHLIGNLWAFVLAHTILAIPYVMLTVAAALRRIDPSLELAAIGLGATRIKAFFLITLPTISASVISGAIFAFLISFDEPVIAFFVSGVQDKPLPRRLFENIQETVSPIAASVSSLLTLLTALLLLAVYFLRRTWPTTNAAK